VKVLVLGGGDGSAAGCARLNLADGRPRGGDRRDNSQPVARSTRSRRESAHPDRNLQDRLAGAWEETAAKPIRFVPLDIAQNYEGPAGSCCRRSGHEAVVAFRRASGPRLYSNESSATQALLPSKQNDQRHPTNLLCAIVRERPGNVHIVHLGRWGVRLRLPPRPAHDSRGLTSPLRFPKARWHPVPREDSPPAPIRGSVYSHDQDADQLLFFYYNKETTTSVFTDLPSGDVCGHQYRSHLTAIPGWSTGSITTADYGTVLNRIS